MDYNFQAGRKQHQANASGMSALATNGCKAIVISPVFEGGTMEANPLVHMA